MFSYISLQTIIKYSTSVRRKRSDKIRAQEGMENQLLKFGKCIVDRETKFMGAGVYRITDENGNTIGSAKGPPYN